MIAEHELVCPGCGSVTMPVYPPFCACGWGGTVRGLVQSGRTRPRQFPIGKYPEAMPFQGPSGPVGTAEDT